MAEEPKLLEYIPERKAADDEWVRVDEFAWRTPPEDLAIAYAAHVIRKQSLTEAEANLKNYVHKEPMRLEGKLRTVKILSSGETLKKPFLATSRAEPGSKEAMEELQMAIPRNAEWRLNRDVCFQVIASVGWLTSLTKARPPDISRDTSEVDYQTQLLPGNLEVAEDAAPSGYNKEQVELLKRAQKLAAEALAKSGGLGEKIKNLPIVNFGEVLFKTFSRTFGSLPDPEIKEREAFEAMQAEAAERAAQQE